MKNSAKKIEKSVLSNIMRILAPIMFPVEVRDFNQYVKGIARLPFDRNFCVATWPKLTQKDKPKGMPEIPYVGGEKYSLVANSEVLSQIAKLLCEKYPNLTCHVSNISNEVFTVNFMAIDADNVSNDYYTPMVSFRNSYNGKVKASASAGLYRITKDGKTLEMHLSENEFTFKHHSDDNTLSVSKISENLEKMLSDSKSIEDKIKALKKIEVSDIAEVMNKIAPTNKTLPKKAVQMAIENVGYQQMLLNQKPNLWLLYTSLVYGIQNHDGELEGWKRNNVESVAWSNLLSHAEIK